MKKQCILYLFLMLPIALFAQEQARGYVFDKESKAAVVGAEVRVQETDIRDTTDEMGNFILDIPKGSHNIIINEENYYTLSYILDRDFHKKITIIYLESAIVIDDNSKKIPNQDSLFLTSKNSVSLSLFEIFAMAIAIRYERFLTPNHSIGLHTTYYFRGSSSISSIGYNYGDYNSVATYTGLKMTPFYRVYPLRKNAFGLFLDAKIPFGYFNFNTIEYRYDQYSFWTFGLGISAGIMSRLPKSNHGVINFSIGYQYFPIVEPKWLNAYGYSIIDWWTKAGPGAHFEVKLTIGGIF